MVRMKDTSFVYSASSALEIGQGGTLVAAEQTPKELEMAHKAFHSQRWLEVGMLCILAASMDMD
jgi:hypothetical protein